MIRLLRYGLIVALLMLLVSRLAAADPPLVGDWYGEGYQPLMKTTMQWLMHRHDDGTFDIQFRHFENCILTEAQDEAGVWTFKDGLYHTLTLTVNGRRSVHDNEYRIESLTDDEMRYVHIGTGTPFSSRKVPPEFTFPDCKISFNATRWPLLG
jgi:hypothetical protein